MTFHLAALTGMGRMNSGLVVVILHSHPPMSETVAYQHISFSKATNTTVPSTEYTLYSYQTWLIRVTHGFTANIHKTPLEMFPSVDLRHLPLQPVSPITSNSKQMYKTKLNLVVLASMEITII